MRVWCGNSTEWDNSNKESTSIRLLLGQRVNIWQEREMESKTVKKRTKIYIHETEQDKVMWWWSAFRWSSASSINMITALNDETSMSWNEPSNRILFSSNLFLTSCGTFSVDVVGHRKKKVLRDNIFYAYELMLYFVNCARSFIFSFCVCFFLFG